MPDSRKCLTCGGLDELMYEIDWKPVYYPPVAPGG